jgi:hypothetical protein
VSAARSLAMARAVASTDAFALLIRASGWPQIVEFHS